MKESKYNHFFPYSDEQYIAYNAMSNSLAFMDNAKFAMFKDYCNNGTALPEDLESDLKKGSFLLDDFVDELEVLRFRLLQTRFNTDHLGLTIVPTNDCNFRCSYCYELDVLSSKYMSQEVQDKIVELLESRKKLISSFSVTWFGGEPLMNFDAVESLSRRFIEICNENEITYSAGMITNGYLLTADVLSRIKDINITFLQVTVDGLPEVHDLKRPLACSGGTFDTIMENLKNGKDLLPSVALRINVDKNNVESGQQIYQFLQDNGLLDKVNPYFGKIENYTEANNETDCLSACDFSEVDYDFATFAASNKEASPIRYPTQKSASCCADTLSSYVIDAEGYIYKCWCDIGDAERCVGSIVDANPVASNDVYLKYMMLDPTIIEPCKTCNVLPICMGGCPYKRLQGSRDNCTTHKFILDKILKNAATAMNSMREKAAKAAKDIEGNNQNLALAN